MSFPKNGFSLNLFPLPFLSSVDSSYTVVYTRRSELEAFTLYRTLSQLSEKTVRLIDLYNFLFSERPYTDSDNIIAFLNDKNDVIPFLDSMWSLGGRGYLITCNVDLKKGKGNVELITRNGELCEIETSLSIVKGIAGTTKGKRSEELLNELNSINTLAEWLKEKLGEMTFDGIIVLSPILLPARWLMEKYLNTEVKGHEDFLGTGGAYIFITTGGDVLTVRRMEFELRSNGKSVKEYTFDVDPLLAPIYLSLLTYLFKQPAGVL
ncbi:hypothetical protein [Stygiolobus caldivivus]|uniref:Uncharacterized protein n=1 Tax=Stygiolobus caldivivus TaxID=2824673 RepID=A0A8D5U411_9CREN|nr:hypothetical protein [Stygiolobus caldivivus]BCU68981.1 hypothetical protein KN1_02780 [Stygiolobus caldivivus]